MAHNRECHLQIIQTWLFCARKDREPLEVQRWLVKLENSAEQHTILQLTGQILNRDRCVPHVARVDPPDQARLIKLRQLFTSLLRLHFLLTK